MKVTHMGQALKASLYMVRILVIATFASCYARADAALLLEEPFGRFGHMNPTGHAAIYLDHVCAASLTSLRRCEADERGVVISRYHLLGGYDWIAVPLIPYLYSVEEISQRPDTIDESLERELRPEILRYLVGTIREADDINLLCFVAFLRRQNHPTAPGFKSDAFILNNHGSVGR